MRRNFFLMTLRLLIVHFYRKAQTTAKASGLVKPLVFIKGTVSLILSQLKDIMSSVITHTKCSLKRNFN